jgi:hypothetical protein
VNAWFDWNRDGDWNDTLQCPAGQPAPEWAVQNQELGVLIPATYTFRSRSFIPYHPTSKPGPIWMRIMLTEEKWPPAGSVNPPGGSGRPGGYQYGETEDYLFTPLAEPEKDWGDAPDPTYPTFSASLGANHVIVPGMFLGASIDSELDGQPDSKALGDDGANLDDEDGVVFNTPLLPASNATVTVTASIAGSIP